MQAAQVGERDHALARRLVVEVRLREAERVVAPHVEPRAAAVGQLQVLDPLVGVDVVDAGGGVGVASDHVVLGVDSLHPLVSRVEEEGVVPRPDLLGLAERRGLLALGDRVGRLVVRGPVRLAPDHEVVHARVALRERRDEVAVVLGVLRRPEPVLAPVRPLRRAEDHHVDLHAVLVRFRDGVGQVFRPDVGGVVGVGGVLRARLRDVVPTDGVRVEADPEVAVLGEQGNAVVVRRPPHRLLDGLLGLALGDERLVLA